MSDFLEIFTKTTGCSSNTGDTHYIYKLNNIESL